MITGPNIPWLNFGKPQADQEQAPDPIAFNLPGASKNEFFELIEQMLTPSAVENATISDEAKVEKNFPEKKIKDPSAIALIINPPLVALAGPMTPVSQSEIPLHPPASATENVENSPRDSDQKTGGTVGPPILNGDLPIGIKDAPPRLNAFKNKPSRIFSGAVPNEKGGSPVPPKADEISELDESADPSGVTENAIASKVKQKGNSSAASAHLFVETTEAPAFSSKVGGDPVPTSASFVGELPARAGELEVPPIVKERIYIRSDESSKTLEAGKKIPAIKPILPGLFATPAGTPAGGAQQTEQETKPAPKLSGHTAASPGYLQSHSGHHSNALPFANPIEDAENISLPENVSIVSDIPVDGWPIKPSPAPMVGVFKSEVADKQADEPQKNIENALVETVSPALNLLKTVAKPPSLPAGHLDNGKELGAHSVSASIDREVVQNQGRLPLGKINLAPHFCEIDSSADLKDAANVLRVEDRSNEKQWTLLPEDPPEKMEGKQVSEKFPGVSHPTVATPIHKLLEEPRTLSKASELRLPVAIFREGLRIARVSIAQGQIADPAEFENGPMDEASRTKSKPEVRQPLNETKGPVEETEETTGGLRPRTHSGTESTEPAFDSEVSRVSEFTASPKPARPDPAMPANLESGGAADIEFRATEAVSNDSSDFQKQSSATTQPISSLQQTSSKNDFPETPKGKSFAVEVLKSAPIDFPEPPLNSIHSTVPEHEPSASSPHDPAAAISSDGKEPAKQELPMKFTEERNKFAERTLQKLPRFDFGEKQSSNSVKMSDAKNVHEKSEREDRSPSTLPIVDWHPNSRATDSGKIFPVNSSRVLDRAPEQIERLAGWINTEVFAIRKTGVRSLTVSLKIDERTEISLGLENHEGKVQASIQCERGDLSGVEHHWEKLQESLSRHNVQLLPLQQGNSARTSISDFQTGASSHFQQQSREQERGRSLEFSFEEMFSMNAVGGGKLNKPKKLAAQRGWESWA